MAARKHGDLSFEDALEKLEQTVHQLEDGGIPLSDALAQYEQGIKHLKTCYAMLQHAERRIEILSGVDAEGNPIAEPLEAEASLQAGEGVPGGKQSIPNTKAAPSDAATDETDIDDSGRLF